MKNIIKILVATLLIASLLGITSCASPVDSPVVEPETYKIELKAVADTYGSVSVDTSAKVDAIVSITVTPEPEYKVDSVTVTAEDTIEVIQSDEDENVYSFKMPDEDVSVEVKFTKKEIPAPEPETTPDSESEPEPEPAPAPAPAHIQKAKPSYPITVKVDTACGNVYVDTKSAKEDELFEVTYKVNTGYKLTNLVVSDNDGTLEPDETGKYKMRTSPVTVSAEFEAIIYKVTYPEVKEGNKVLAEKREVEYRYGDTVDLTSVDAKDYENVAYIKYTASSNVINGSDIKITAELWFKEGVSVNFKFNETQLYILTAEEFENTYGNIIEYNLNAYTNYFTKTSLVNDLSKDNLSNILYEMFVLRLWEDKYDSSMVGILLASSEETFPDKYLSGYFTLNKIELNGSSIIIQLDYSK